MALIECPECGSKVSDTVEACIHCGYVLKQKKYTIFYKNKECDLTPIVPEILNNEPIFKIWQWTSSNYNIIHFPSLELMIKDIQDGTPLKHSVEDYEHEVYVRGQARQQAEKAQREAGLPHCPTCNSTNLTRFAGSKKTRVGMLGLIVAKESYQWKCKNCGYQW